MKIYYETYSEAVQAALDSIGSLTYNEDDYFTIVATNSFRPGIGKTTRWILPLYNNGKQNRVLVVNVYGMESGNYELNSYVG